MMMRRVFGFLLVALLAIAPAAQARLTATNLSGFGGGAPQVSFTFVSSGSGTTATVTIPTMQAGDLCLIWSYGRNTFTTGPGAGPAGFTELAYVNGSAGGSLHAKILTGSETTVTTYVGGNASRWVALVFRPSSTITSVTLNSYNVETTAGDPASQTILAAAGSAPMILTGQMAASASPGTRTTSPAMTEVAATGGLQFVHYTIVNPGEAGVDTTYDQSDGGNNNALQSGYLTFN